MKSWQTLLALCLTALGQNHAHGNPSELKWLSGENICTGGWNYTKMASCGYVDDVNSPLYQTVNEDITVVEPCRVRDVYDVVETRDVPLEWEDSRIAPSCGAHMPADNDNLDFWVSKGISDIQGPRNGRCKSRNALRTCVSWHDVFNATCKFERRLARTITDANRCATRIEQRPKQVPAGFSKLVGYHPSCPGATSAVSGKLLPRSNIQASNIDPASVQCSTLDDVAATTPDIVRAKFDAYLALAFELAGEQGNCPIKEPVYAGLKSIAENGSQALTEDQLSVAFEVIDILTSECNSSSPSAALSAAQQKLGQLFGEQALQFKANADAQFYMVTYYLANRNADQSVTLNTSRRSGSNKYQFNTDGSILLEQNGVKPGKLLLPGTEEMKQQLSYLKSDLAINLATAQRLGPAEVVPYLQAFIDYATVLAPNAN